MKVYQNCKLGDLQPQHADGWGYWGFTVNPPSPGSPVVGLTYVSEAEAKAAHAMMAKVIIGAAITPGM